MKYKRLGGPPQARKLMELIKECNAFGPVGLILATAHINGGVFWKIGVIAMLWPKKEGKQHQHNQNENNLCMLKEKRKGSGAGTS